jgi:hypothetical protein
VEHKKRGRPRIQSDRAQQRASIATTAPSSELAVGEASRLYHAQPPYLGRRGSLPVPSPSLGGAVYGAPPSHDMYSGPVHAPRPEDPRKASPLFAFLNLDLKFLKLSSSLQNLLDDRRDFRNSSLEHILEYRHRQDLSRLQSWLRGERERIAPLALPRITSSDQEIHDVERLGIHDIDRITQGSGELTYTWSLLVANGRVESFSVRIRLAQMDGLFFTTLTMHWLTSPSAPAASYGMRQPAEHRGSIDHRGVHLRESPYNPPGPSSPFARSAPESPFSNVPPHSISTLPPPMQTSLATAGYVSPEARDPSGSSYFPRQPPHPPPMHGSAMQPPPQPLQGPSSLPGISRSRRPEPIGTLAALGVSSSAPVTPVGSQFNIEQHGAPGSAPSMPSVSSSAEPSSVQRRRPSPAEDSGEDTRKRRRLNIGEIIEK